MSQPETKPHFTSLELKRKFISHLDDQISEFVNSQSNWINIFLYLGDPTTQTSTLFLYFRQLPVFSLGTSYITFVEQLITKSSGPDSNPVTPNLHTVTIGDVTIIGEFQLSGPELASVCELISIRKSINLPITTLRLANFCGLSCINWLRDNVCSGIRDCEIAVFSFQYLGSC